MRNAAINRKTNETDIRLSLSLDGAGASKIDTGCGFFDHMLTLLTFHGGFDMELKCIGDVQVDYHHTVEDIGIAFGQALSAAISDRKGITRYGSFIMPMDEALIMCALDISGRSYLGYDMAIPTQKVGELDTELIKEFFLAFTREAKLTLHLRMLSGENSHHIIEAAFKGFGRALAIAVSLDAKRGNTPPSSKGTLI